MSRRPVRLPWRATSRLLVGHCPFLPGRSSRNHPVPAGSAAGTGWFLQAAVAGLEHPLQCLIAVALHAVTAEIAQAKVVSRFGVVFCSLLKLENLFAFGFDRRALEVSSRSRQRALRAAGFITEAGAL